MEKQATKPYHPLIGKQPVETLSYVQTLLSFAEEFTAQATEGPELTHHQIRVYDGLYTLLKTANEALGYEIERLEHSTPPKPSA